jgi:hypothetical protein
MYKDMYGNYPSKRNILIIILNALDVDVEKTSVPNRYHLRRLIQAVASGKWEAK